MSNNRVAIVLLSYSVVITLHKLNIFHRKAIVHASYVPNVIFDVLASLRSTNDCHMTTFVDAYDFLVVSQFPSATILARVTRETRVSSVLFMDKTKALFRSNVPLNYSANSFIYIVLEKKP